MENIINEQAETLEKAQPVVTEENLGAKEGEASFGKFKDADSLLKAYNSLTAEFTKRCQKIKELEGKINENSVKTSEEDKTKQEGITEEEKQEILKGYLKEVLNSKTKAIVMDGKGVSLKTPPSKPKTIEEAGKLVKEIFSK